MQRSSVTSCYLRLLRLKGILISLRYESSLTSLDRERWIGRTLTGVCVPLVASRSRSRMKETVECVSGSTRRAESRVLRLIPLWPAQSDASQEAERLTDDWTGRSADVPNLSYSQFVLFYSFIALANCVAAYLFYSRQGERALFLLVTISGAKSRIRRFSR